LNKEEKSVQATFDGWIEPGIDHISGERRGRQRFTLRLPVEYKVLSDASPLSGYGTTLDLSSSGIAFEVDEDLRPGCQVEVAVRWPVPQDGGTPLRLILRGTLLRQERRIAALQVQTCQFRTQKRARAAGTEYAN
jgi:PilZ domain